MGDLIQRMIRYFAVVRRVARRHRRAVVAAAAVVVFVTTYALVLPAITLDEQTANDEPGIELGATSEEATDATAEVAASEQESATDEAEPAASAEEPDAQGIADEQSTTTDTASDTTTYLSDGTTLTFDQDDWHVTAEINANAQLPAGTTLQAKEITGDDWQAYHDAALAKLQEEDSSVAELDQARFFDVSFVDKDGNEVEPAAEVKVTVSYDQAVQVDDASDVKVVHFDDETGDASVLADDKTSVDAPDNNLQKVDFQADSFSVYGIVEGHPYRRTYEFYLDRSATQAYSFQDEDGNTVNWQIVKNGDKLQDPGIPPSPSTAPNATFLGWYTVDGNEAFDITQTMSGITANDTVKLYAKFGNYTVTYHDEDGNVIDTVNNAGGSYTVDHTYTPHTSDKAFVGWATSSDAEQSDVVTTLDVTSSVDLYPVLASAYWITFDAQGGVPVSSKYVISGQSVANVPTTTRTGYTFEGWYTLAEGGEQVADSSGTVIDTYQNITSNLTVYAHWQPAAASYTIVFWKQNADDDNYTYAETVSATGTTGDQTSVTGSEHTSQDYSGFHIYGQGTGTVAGEEENNPAYQITQQTIAGDGSTVVNVYYNRDWYYIHFYHYEQSSTGGYYYFPGGYIVSGNQYVHYSEGYYALGNGPWSSTRQNNSTVYYYIYTANWQGRYTMESYSYSFRRYVRTEYTGLRVYQKYESDVRTKWPSNVSSSYSDTWEDTTNEYTWTGYYVMPLDGIDFVESSTSGDYVSRRRYYLMDTSGNYPAESTPTFTEDLRADEDQHWYLADYYPIHGFTLDTSLSAPRTVNGNKNYGTQQSDYLRVWDLYYSRNQYMIEFRSGLDTSTSFGTKTGIYYEADISNSADDVTVTAPKGYVFDGWYTLPESAGWGEKYDFSGKTMPAGNLVVYAKFSPITYTVTYDKNSGTWNDTSESKSETHKYGDKATEYTSSDLSRDGYEFVGWYLVDSDGNVSATPYNFNDSVTENITLRAIWRKSGAPYNVKYDSNGGGEVTDTNNYADRSEVTVAQAPMPPTNKVFISWQLTYASGDKTETVTYKPGEQFVLDVDTMDVASDGTQDKTVTLKALYDDVDTTSIRFHGNGGTDSDATVTITDGAYSPNSNTGYTPATSGSGTTEASITKLELNASIDLSKIKATREGYELVGWSTDSTRTADDFNITTNPSTDFATNAVVGVDGSNNDLYAVWKRVVSINVIKTDESGTNKLGGVTFKLVKQNGSAWPEVSLEGVNDGSFSISETNKETGVILRGLGDGTYKLTETTAPDGYVVATKAVMFTVSGSTVTLGTNVTDSDATLTSPTTDKPSYYTLTVKNTPGEALPNTGGAGTTPFAVAGAALITLAIAGTALRRWHGRGDA